jgi:hypothetical protein
LLAPAGPTTAPAGPTTVPAQPAFPTSQPSDGDEKAEPKHVADDAVSIQTEFFHRRSFERN